MSVVNLFWYLFMGIFILHAYEDYQTKTISLFTMIISILLISYVQYKVVLLYFQIVVFYKMLSYVFESLPHHLGFGDLWYISFFIFYFQNYITLFSLVIYLLYFVLLRRLKTVDTIPLIPILFIGTLLCFFVKYYLK